jgi:DNA topoisomerase IB
MTLFTLPRSGQQPLVFTGEGLAESLGDLCEGQEQSRWHNIKVYRTTGGKYVLAIQYRTRWTKSKHEENNEVARDVAEVLPNSGALTSRLLGYDACAAVVGFPPLPSFQHKQERLLASVRDRFAAQVSDVLSCSEEFAEVVK